MCLFFAFIAGMLGSGGWAAFWVVMHWLFGDSK